MTKGLESYGLAIGVATPASFGTGFLACSLAPAERVRQGVASARTTGEL
jgi:hypothetical protein